MSIWIKTSEQLPPLYERVLVLYKFRYHDLKSEFLHCDIDCMLKDIHLASKKDWAKYTAVSNYEVIYWAKLPDMPRLEEEE